MVQLELKIELFLSRPLSFVILAKPSGNGGLPHLQNLVTASVASVW